MKNLIPVWFHGFQERPKQAPLVLVFPPDSLNTLEYKPKEHKIINTLFLYKELENLGGIYETINQK